MQEKTPTKTIITSNLTLILHWIAAIFIILKWLIKFVIAYFTLKKFLSFEVPKWILTLNRTHFKSDGIYMPMELFFQHNNLLLLSIHDLSQISLVTLQRSQPEQRTSQMIKQMNIEQYVSNVGDLETNINDSYVHVWPENAVLVWNLSKINSARVPTKWMVNIPIIVQMKSIFILFSFRNQEMYLLINRNQYTLNQNKFLAWRMNYVWKKMKIMNVHPTKEHNGCTRSTIYM